MTFFDLLFIGSPVDLLYINPNKLYTTVFIIVVVFYKGQTLLAGHRTLSFNKITSYPFRIDSFKYISKPEVLTFFNLDGLLLNYRFWSEKLMLRAFIIFLYNLVPASI